MEIDVLPIPGAANLTCISISGRIDSYTVEHVEEELNSLIRIGSSRLICDLSEVGFVSSGGFKAFRRVLDLAREQNGDLKFCSLGEELSRIFNSVGFSDQVDIYSTVEEAAAGFNSGKSGEKSKPQSSSLNALRRLVGLGKTETQEEGSEDQQQEQPSTPATDAHLQQTKIFPTSSSVQETVIFANSQTGEPGVAVSATAEAAAQVEPIKVQLHPDPSLFPSLSQIFGAVASLVGFPSMTVVNLNVAVLELCRAIGTDLKSDETFTMEIEGQCDHFEVTLVVPIPNFNIYAKLKPRNVTGSMNEQQSRDWLLNYVGEVEMNQIDGATKVLLSIDSHG